MEKRNYSHLKGKIVEKCGSQNTFSQKLGISKQALSKKMNNQSHFSQEQIQKSIEILQLNETEVIKCFFNSLRVE